MKKKILMVYPEYPVTFWGLQYSLTFVNKKSLMPPLGLLTVAAMLPSDYEIKLIDMNVKKLHEEDIKQADMIFLSAMIIQKESFNEVVKECNRLNKPVIAGGPFPTSSYESIEGVDHFVLGEGENTIPKFIYDYENGMPEKIYRAEVKPEITITPIPRYDLIDVNDYESLPLQFSRGCPFSCEFCDIIEMFGRKPRLKSVEQFLNELECIFNIGYRGPVLIVDDNFIGNKNEVLKLLKGLKEWQESKSFPFNFFTESSVNLASETEILELMIDCGFSMVFLGLETPDENTLNAINKKQNVRYNLHESVRIIQDKGLEVSAGFILGFDTDREDIFERQINFIQKAGIPMAMIGIILVLPGTQLFKRLEKEGRILYESSGNNTNMLDLNFIPLMDKEKIVAGYKNILKNIYSPEKYFERSLTLLSRIPYRQYKGRRFQKSHLRAFFKSLLLQSFSRYGLIYIRFLLKTLMINWRNFPLAINLAIKGYHFFKLTDQTLAYVEDPVMIEKNYLPVVTNPLDDGLQNS